MMNPQSGKPKMKPVGEDGNIFSLRARAYQLLTSAGMKVQADEMIRRVHAFSDYYTALQIISEYVEPELT